MSKKRKAGAASTRKTRRFSIPLLAAIVVVTATAITVISRQVVTGKAAKQVATQVAGSTGKQYVTVKVAGQDVQVDSQTGQIKPLTPQEAKQLADGLKGLRNNQSTNGLVAVKQSDGSVVMDLQGRFQNVTLARRNDDGTLEEACVDEPQAAAQFFGIDPQLLGAPANGVSAKPVAKSAPKKVGQ